MLKYGIQFFILGIIALNFRHHHGRKAAGSAKNGDEAVFWIQQVTIFGRNVKVSLTRLLFSIQFIVLELP
jgi:hypothetical protein